MRMVRCRKSMGEHRLLLLVTTSVQLLALLLLAASRPAQTFVVSNQASKRGSCCCSGPHIAPSRCLSGAGTSATTQIESSQQQFRQSQPFLTVIIPAYNEQERIGTTLQAYQSYLLAEGRQQCWKGRSRTLVVDDGSIDQTVAVVRRFASARNDITTSTAGSENDDIGVYDGNVDSCPILCMSLNNNQGKGGAIAAGIAHVLSYDAGSSEHSSSNVEDSLILTADADGSADPSCLEALYKVLLELLYERQQDATGGDDDKDSSGSIWKYAALVCGYRVYDSDSKDGRGDFAQKSTPPSSSLLRQVFHWGFRTTVRILFWGTGLNEIRDTQCGCKLLTLTAAQQLYTNLHLRRWSHDVEVLLRATTTKRATTVGQAPVPWRDCAGSRLAAEGVVRVAGTMLAEIAYCRIAYAAGWWK